MDPALDDVASAPAGAMAGAHRTPQLELNGFSGPLDLLLTLARAEQADLRGLSLPHLVDQLAMALRQAGPATPLGQKADWVVMAAWLLLLRSLLLLPADTPAQRAAEAEAEELRGQLVALEEMQALAAWLERRPQLGRDVFPRGHPEWPGVSAAPGDEVDVIAFLWASMALFETGDGVDTSVVYRPPRFDLHSVPEARARILRLLAEAPDGGPLDGFLPYAPGDQDPDDPNRDNRENRLLRRSAWTTTFAASLELARQGDVALAQDGAFRPITLSRAR